MLFICIDTRKFKSYHSWKTSSGGFFIGFYAITNNLTANALVAHTCRVQNAFMNVLTLKVSQVQQTVAQIYIA